VKCKLLVTIKEVSNMTIQQEFAIVPHISAAGTRTGVVQTVPSCLDEVMRICKEMDEV
jgi:hypothetical protein